MKAKIQGNKDKVKSWARTVLSNKLVVCAQLLKVKGKDGMLVTDVFGIGESWKHNDSVTNAEKMWNILFGQFDKQHGWETAMESDFMTEYQWQYKELLLKEECHDARNKGCIAKLMSLVKGELVKNVNKRSKKGHDKHLIKSSAPVERTSDGKPIYQKSTKKKLFSEKFIAGGAGEEMVIDYNHDETISTFSTHNETWHNNEDETVQKLQKRLAEQEKEKKKVITTVIMDELVHLFNLWFSLIKFCFPDLATQLQQQLQSVTDRAAKEVKKASREVELIVETAAKQVSEKQAHDDVQAVTKMKKKVGTILKRKGPTEIEPPSTPDTPPLSEYERRRLQNIEKNNMRLRQIDPWHGIERPAQKSHKKKKKSVSGNKESNSMKEKVAASEEPTDAGEKYVIQKLLKSRKTSHGIQIQVLWEGGSKSWEPMEELKKDVPDDVDSLLRSEEASVGRVETEHAPEKPTTTSFKCDIDHSNYQLGIVYKQETNDKYCKMGCYLFEVKCGSCGKQFVEVVSVKDNASSTYRPSEKTPVYTCINHTKGCRYAVCGVCFIAGMTTTETRGSRRK